eukprot:g3279.t1
MQSSTTVVIVGIATILLCSSSSFVRAVFVPQCETCCQINPHLASSAYAGLLNGAFDGSGQGNCVANKGYYGSLSAEQESVCEFWFNQGKPDLSRIPGTCEDGAMPTCSDMKPAKCGNGKDAMMGMCGDGRPALCTDKRPPLCADGAPLDPSSMMKSPPAVFNDQTCGRFCKQNTGLCVEASSAANLFKALLQSQLTAPSNQNATTAAKPAAGGEAAAAGAEAAKPPAFRRVSTEIKESKRPFASDVGAKSRKMAFVRGRKLSVQ